MNNYFEINPLFDFLFIDDSFDFEGVTDSPFLQAPNSQSANFMNFSLLGMNQQVKTFTQGLEGASEIKTQQKNNEFDDFHVKDIANKILRKADTLSVGEKIKFTLYLPKVGTMDVGLQNTVNTLLVSIHSASLILRKKLKNKEKKISQSLSKSFGKKPHIKVMDHV